MSATVVLGAALLLVVLTGLLCVLAVGLTRARHWKTDYARYLDALERIIEGGEINGTRNLPDGRRRG